MARSAALQQEAVEQLEEAIEQLDNAKQARDEQLRRLAQSLVETIEGLVRTQTIELEQLARGVPDRSAPMIRLNTRTFAAAELARSERELRQVARPLDSASLAQQRAITSLRAIPRDTESALDAERESLSALIDALAEAKRLQEQIEQEAMDRQREEIKQAYIVALAAQKELRERTRLVAGGAQPDRRTRAELRRFAVEQDALSESVRELKKTTQELEDAVVFRFAHRKLDTALGRAQASLEEADSARALHAQGRAIVLLRSLIDALAEDENGDDDNFNEGSGGGSGGGSQGGEQELIPGGAQLKLLRAIQSDLLDRTRAIDDGLSATEELGEVGSEQRELSEVGQTLIDELTQDPPPTVTPLTDPPDEDGADS